VDTNIHYKDEETGEIERTVSFRQMIREFIEDFLDHGFNPLMESVFDDIYKESPRLEENDRIFYFIILAQSFSFIRHKYYNEKKLAEMSAKGGVLQNAKGFLNEAKAFGEN
jgi:hypothetical protein